jgi:hypothetical protein
MPVWKRELAFKPERAGSNAGDWWHLVLDPAVPGLFVEHTWRRTSAVSGNEGVSGAERFGINDFLTFAQREPARAALLTALGEMFRRSGLR